MLWPSKYTNLLLLLALVAALSGCTPWTETVQGQTANIPAGEIYGPHTVGQTFVARWGGLNGVEVLLATYARPNSRPLIFHLRANPESTEDLATVTVAASDVVDNAYHTFSFPVQSGSDSRRYFFVLESPTAQPGDAFTAWQGPAESYEDGALYLAGQPQEGQLVFRLHYDPLRLLLALAGEMAQAIPWGLALAALLLLPGLALLLWLQPADAAGWSERLTVAPALSAALAPLVMLWAHVLHLRMGRLVIVAGLVLAAAAIVVRFRRGAPALRPRRQASLPLPVLSLLILLVAATRWLAARGLEVPMWGDSYQHTMLAQLLIDRGGLFQSWEPYAPLRSLTYHFGFHSLVAAQHWVSGQPAATAVIVIGQVLNVLAVLGLYPLAVRLTNNRWAGVGAVLVAGLFSPMPQFYINWGRYTQLAGQAVLPMAILLTLHAIEGRRRREIVLAGLAVAGLSLTHYRVFLFYLCFFLAWLPFHLAHEGELPARGRRALARLSLVGIVALLVDLPWAMNLLSSRLANMYGRLAEGHTSTYVRTGYNAVGDIHPYLPAALIGLMLLAALWALLHRRRGATVVIVWTVFLLLLANPSLLGLPGTGVVNNFAVFIALYMPAGLLVGYMLGDLTSALQRWQPLAGRMMVALFLVAALFGAKTMAGVRDARYQMVSRPDTEAMAWIRQNTPADARFLVNGFTAYGDSVVVGADAGWWIPLLAGRANTVPPLIYGTEKTARPEMRQELLAFYHRVQQADFGDAETARWLRAAGVTHVYLGQRQGQIGFGEKHPLVAADLLASPYFQPVYHHDLVWIFALSAN